MPGEDVIYVEIPTPLVKRPRLLKHAGIDQGMRPGKGFSELELKEAGLSIREARKLGIPIDLRRRSAHSWNIEALKKFLEQIRELRSVPESR